MDAPAIYTSQKHPASSPSTLKLVSLPVASGASLRLVLADVSRLAPTPTDNEVMLYRYRKGGRNRERNRRIPRISPRFVLRLRLQKGGVFAGHYGNKNMPTYIYEHDYTSHTVNTCKWKKEDSLVPTYKTENHCRRN